MHLTVYYKNGIVEEFTLGIKSAQNLIERLIESKLVKKIMSFDKVIFKETTPDNTKELNKLKQLHNEAEFWFNAAELDILDGTYFQNNPMKKKMPESVRQHNQKMKQQNFYSVSDKLNNIKKDFLSVFKDIGLKTTHEERKQIMKYRKDIENMIKASHSYIEILA